MTFIDELEKNIRATYFEILRKRKYPTGINGKTLNCDSFRKIAEEIKTVIFDCQNKGLGVLEIANNIIFKILKDELFIIENHQMAALIGYLYLKRQKVDIRKYSIGNISNNSTLEEIRIVTSSW